jgi:hypothetical protein
MAGYSGTTLEKKLGIKEHFRIRIVNAPAHYFNLFTSLPKTIHVTEVVRTKKDLIHFFPKDSQEFYTLLPKLKNEIEPNGMIWVSWPKKSSGIASDLTEDLIRSHGIRSGLVDIKVCAVDETWSALKFVIPVKDRNPR